MYIYIYLHVYIYTYTASGNIEPRNSMHFLMQIEMNIFGFFGSATATGLSFGCQLDLG